MKIRSNREPLRLMCILAHPDDESMGTGGILAKYAAEGVETYLVIATRGERGWWGGDSAYPGAEALGMTRQAELMDAAGILGLKEVNFLDYIDGEVDQADPGEAISRLVLHIKRVRPDVVVTFDPYGYYGHPDHIAIAQFANAAIVEAASSSYERGNRYPPHTVSKLYYMALTAADFDAYQAAFGELSMNIDGVRRNAVAWPEWALTTHVDTVDYWQQVWQAIACHRSQLPGYQALLDLPDERHRQLWGCQTLFRAFSLVNGGRKLETDLFEGIRQMEVEYA
jgi:LmbE family N-acetylglucosaminyl deacetylase